LSVNGIPGPLTLPVMSHDGLASGPLHLSPLYISTIDEKSLMEELHTDSNDGGHEASYGLGHVPGRGRTPTVL
jgi:hypothetical protein